MHSRLLSSALIALAIAGVAGCLHGVADNVATLEVGRQFSGGGLRIAEDIGPTQPHGTLIAMELITPLTREEALARFRPADLEAVGLKEADVQYGTALFATPWHQGGSRFTPVQGVIALAKPGLSSRFDAGASTCRPYGGGCSYGGDTVAVRVVRSGAGDGALYVIDAIVEPRKAQGDCQYIRHQRREMLFCRSLEAKGWEAKDGLFLKQPAK